jgi:hypothetical protein
MEPNFGVRSHEASGSAKPCQCAGGCTCEAVRNKGVEALKPNCFANFDACKKVSRQRQVGKVSLVAWLKITVD